MKEEAPEAFQSTYPFKGSPRVAYIDGMPLLMTCERNVKSWDDLLRFNYARQVSRYFQLGCHAVVLAFDDYERVPAAKAITQANRVKKKAAYEFGEGQQLPPTMPHQYNEKLSNRIFKRRVIDMVCNRLVEHVRVSASERYTRQLVIDYTGCPIVFEAKPMQPSFECGRPTFLPDLPPMGEADIKFLRWAEHFGGDMVAFSIDGDFIPIALMQYEAQVHRLSEHQRMKLSTPPPALHNVCIYRIKYKAPASSSASSAAGSATNAACATKVAKKKPFKYNSIGQRLLTDASSTLGLAPPLPQSSAGGAAPETKKEASTTKHAPREFEYVNIPRLYMALRTVFSGFCPTLKRDPLHPHHYMRMLAVLVGLGGTDFSRGLPYIGPGTLWSMLPERSVFSSLLRCYEPSRGLVESDSACNMLACNVYMHKFASHFKRAAAAASVIDVDDEDEEDNGGGDSGGFKRMLNVLLCSQLSDKTKRDLPSPARVNTTFRNINWLLHYWTCKPPTKRVAGDGEAAQAPAAAAAGNPLWDYSQCYPNPV
jgi:hypothetical protein